MNREQPPRPSERRGQAPLLCIQIRLTSRACRLVLCGGHSGDESACVLECTCVRVVVVAVAPLAALCACVVVRPLCVACLLLALARGDRGRRNGIDDERSHGPLCLSLRSQPAQSSRTSASRNNRRHDTRSDAMPCQRTRRQQGQTRLATGSQLRISPTALRHIGRKQRAWREGEGKEKEEAARVQGGETPTNEASDARGVESARGDRENVADTPTGAALTLWPLADAAVQHCANSSKPHSSAPPLPWLFPPFHLSSLLAIHGLSQLAPRGG